MRHRRRNVGRGGCSLVSPAPIAAPTSTETKLIARLANSLRDVLRRIWNDSLLQTSKVAPRNDHRSSQQEGASVGDEASRHTQLFDLERLAKGQRAAATKQHLAA